MSASSACSTRGCRRISSRSTATSCATASFWVPTEANSPSAIENAPATSPAIPVRMIVSRSAPPPPTPATSAMLVTSPSIAPNTAARSQPPETSAWWWSWWRRLRPVRAGSSLEGNSALPSTLDIGRGWPQVATGTPGPDTGPMRRRPAVGVRRPARAARARDRRAPAPRGRARRVGPGVAPPPLPPAEAAPGAVGHAAPGRGARRPGRLPARRDLPRGAGAGRPPGTGARADLARRRRPGASGCAQEGLVAEVLPTPTFALSRAEFDEWAGDRETFRMEEFYRSQRRRFDVLMDAGEPVGGRWNYDHENREPPPKGGAGSTCPGRGSRPRTRSTSGSAPISTRWTCRRSAATARAGSR